MFPPCRLNKFQHLVVFFRSVNTLICKCQMHLKLILLPFDSIPFSPEITSVLEGLHILVCVFMFLIHICVIKTLQSTILKLILLTVCQIKKILFCVCSNQPPECPNGLLLIFISYRQSPTLNSAASCKYRTLRKCGVILQAIPFDHFSVMFCLFLMYLQLLHIFNTT